jgi:hypothetical protein
MLEDCETQLLRNQLKNQIKIWSLRTSEKLETEKPGCWRGFGTYSRKVRIL